MKNTTMLKKNYEFKNVLTKGKRYFGKNINIYIKQSNDKGNKIGIAVSKKCANSVHRNKIKRLIRENYRIYEQNIKTGFHFVFLWNKNVKAEDADFYGIKEDFENAFKRADIFKIEE